MQEAYPVATPLDPNVQLVKDDGVSNKANKLLYQQILGSLQYAAGCTRPDIAQAVNVLARYSADPNESHLTNLKRVLRYLKGTINLALTYKGTEPAFTGYSDADWAGDREDRKSTSGYVFLQSGAAISWASRKQTSVPLSTVEAEYVALSLATQEIVWLRQLLSELGEDVSGPSLLMEDNQGAIATANNPVNHAKTKHIQIKYHHVRDAVEQQTIELCYCRSKEMLADIFTKPSPRDHLLLLSSIIIIIAYCACLSIS